MLLVWLPGVGNEPLLAQTTPAIPRLTQYATDLTGTLSQGELASLSEKLDQFDRSTSTQIVVLIVATTGEIPLEDFTLKVAELNKIGRARKDNGALLFIAKSDRRMRIEVGRGLEGVLPDILAGQIIRNEISPRFREGDYYGGISAGVEAMFKATRNEYTAEPQSSKKSPGWSISTIILIIIIFIVISRIFRGPGSFTGRGPRTGAWFPPIGGGWGGGGGGFGGGGLGGGGFSGGGGSFSGGGASGGW